MRIALLCLIAACTETAPAGELEVTYFEHNVTWISGTAFDDSVAGTWTVSSNGVVLSEMPSDNHDYFALIPNGDLSPGDPIDLEIDGVFAGRLIVGDQETTIAIE